MAEVPESVSAYPKVILHAKRASPFYARHPWVYPGPIDRVEGEPADGGVVDVCAANGSFIARGLFNSHSKIRVRLLAWDESQPIDEAFFRLRVSQAISLREALGFRVPGASCRLVFSEADRLPGLVVDDYAGWLVIQVTSLGLVTRLDMLVQILDDLLHPRGIYLKTDAGMAKLEGMETTDRLLRGEFPPPGLMIEENGLHFEVDLTQGQKTGYYLDQRDNRQLVARFAGGRRVLDLFCYAGGFGLHAARAGAKHVEFVDGSEHAVELARKNALLNGLTGDNTFVKADAFKYLEAQVIARRRFDLVVLDPPKFARSANTVGEALNGYRRLYSLGMRLLEPGGILAVCCCSGLILPGMIEELLGRLASSERRDIQVLTKLTQPADHPVAVTCPESAYLKGYICRVL